MYLMATELEKGISLYNRYEGIKKIISMVFSFIAGIVLIILGVILWMGLNNPVPFVILGIIGFIFLIATYLFWKIGKREAKGEVYYLGKGWKKPENN